eukprot:scaffold628_cov401-Prasinococcus_capsulatus_cf.AAC.3
MHGRADRVQTMPAVTVSLTSDASAAPGQLRTDVGPCRCGCSHCKGSHRYTRPAQRRRHDIWLRGWPCLQSGRIVGCPVHVGARVGTSRTLLELKLPRSRPERHSLPHRWWWRRVLYLKESERPRGARLAYRPSSLRPQGGKPASLQHSAARPSSPVARWRPLLSPRPANNCPDDRAAGGLRSTLDAMLHTVGVRQWMDGWEGLPAGKPNRGPAWRRSWDQIPKYSNQ